jgi:uncharacterized protein (TIGR03437 family)
MKSPIAIVIFAAIAACPASAIVNLGTSSQNFTLTGIGPSSSGNGQSNMGWGSCPYDGTNTTCTLSGPFTGFGAGGTYSFVITYPGNGTFPLIAVTVPGSDQFTAQSTGNFSLTITLTQPNVAPINFYSFANFNFQYTAPACTGVPASSCSVGHVGQTAGATITGPIIGTFDPTPMITPGGALTPDSYGSFTSTAPASWMVIYGVNLATVRSQIWASSDFNKNIGPTNLGGTSVTVAGVPAYVSYVSPGQVNVQVPSGIPTGMQAVKVTTAGGTSAAYMINVNATEPGMLAPLSFNINGHQNIVGIFSNTNTYVLPVPISGVATARAKVGDLITFYGIGFGSVTPVINAGQIVGQTNTLQLPLQISFANVPAQINYMGLVPSIVGLYQFNVVVPNVAPSDTVPVAFTLNNVPGSQSMVIAIGN